MIVGFTCGAFDMVHPGHVTMFRQAKHHCNTLIVGLHTNPQTDRPEKNKPIQSVYERYTQLVGCTYIDLIIPYDTEQDLCNLLAIEPIDVRFVGEEYTGIKLTGDEICQKKNIQTIYLPRLHNYSSTELRKRIHES